MTCKNKNEESASCDFVLMRVRVVFSHEKEKLSTSSSQKRSAIQEEKERDLKR